MLKVEGGGKTKVDLFGTKECNPTGRGAVMNFHKTINVHSVINLHTEEMLHF